MTSIIFSHAKSIRKKILKDIEELRVNNPDYDYDNHYQVCVQSEIKEFKEYCKIAVQLHEAYREIAGIQSCNWYWVTIHPKNDTDLPTFLKYIEKYINRATIIDYKYSIEQKGTSLETLGNGKHIHLIINAKWRSVGECARDTCSTFAKIADKPAIKIKTTREPDKLFNDYCIEYKSNDDHKQSTKIWDVIWREQEGLKTFYQSVHQVRGQIEDSHGNPPSSDP